MAIITPNAATVWADGPSGNPHEPDKAQVRAWGKKIEASLPALMIYDTVVGMADIAVPSDIHTITINGRNEAGDGDDGMYVDTDTGSDDTFESADGRTWYRADSKANTALQPADNFVSRAGNYIGVGQQANFDGFGKGGVYLGGGHEGDLFGRGWGTYLTLDGLRNWVAVQANKPYNPTEFIVYGSSAQGYAQCVIGGGTITKLYGSNFSSDFVGNTIYFLRKKFKVASVASATSLVVTELDGSPVIFPTAEIEAFNYNYTTGDGICNVVGDRVHWVSGDPFVPLFFRDFQFKINGVVRTVAEFISVTEVRLSAAPGDISNALFAWRGDINDQLSTLRLQAIAGSNEENVNLYSIAGDRSMGAIML